MSAEVAKKRGRPKKVISDPITSEVPEIANKTTTRAKSTKAAPKVVKPAPAKPTTPPKASKPVASPSAASKPPSNTPPAAPKPAQKSTPPPPTKAATPPPPPSKITSQVQELSAKNGNPGFPAKAPNATNASKPAAAASTSPSKPSSPTPIKSTPPPPPKPASNPRIPLTEMNAEIVSNLTGRAGAKPSGGKQLPPGYKPLARQITMTIVAIPIALVTSYVLYQRLVLGEYKSLMPMPGSAPREDAPGVVEAKEEVVKKAV